VGQYKRVRLGHTREGGCHAARAVACRALPLLLRQLDLVAERPECAASAASALWALLHRSDRVKATLKGVAGAVDSIERCTGACENLLRNAPPESSLRQHWQLTSQSAVLLQRALRA
jgi:hypothetical protein